MKMEVHLNQKMEQRMQLSQQMLQNLELLQMPLMALKEKIEEELQENPTLELTEPEEPETQTAAAKETVEEERKREYMESFDEHWAETERRGFRGGSDEDKKQEMLQNVGEGPASLRDHLRNQLSLLEVANEHPLVPRPPDQQHRRFPATSSSPWTRSWPSVPDEMKKEPPEILRKRFENALLMLQKLEPRGIGARSPKECLLLQLDETDPQYPAKRRLIEHHLEDIAANRLPKIVKDFLKRSRGAGRPRLQAPGRRRDHHGGPEPAHRGRSRSSIRIPERTTRPTWRRASTPRCSSGRSKASSRSSSRTPTCRP